MQLFSHIYSCTCMPLSLFRIHVQVSNIFTHHPVTFVHCISLSTLNLSNQSEQFEGIINLVKIAVQILLCPSFPLPSESMSFKRITVESRFLAEPSIFQTSWQLELKVISLPSVEYCNFTLSFQTNFHFPLEVWKFGIPSAVLEIHYWVPRGAMVAYS